MNKATIEILEGSPQVSFSNYNLALYPDTQYPCVLGSIEMRTGDAQSLIERVQNNHTNLKYRNPMTLEIDEYNIHAIRGETVDEGDKVKVWFLYEVGNER